MTINKEWQEQILTWEYGAAASPNIPEVPFHVFPATLHEQGDTAIIPLDLSDVLKTDYLATTPNLLANYVHIKANESIKTEAISSSEVFYILRGTGHTETDQGTLEWKQGDVFTLPTNSGLVHYASEDSALCWLHDNPILSYIGAIPNKARFKPAFYSKEFLDQQIENIREAGIRENRNRNGVILGNPISEDTRTMTPTLWSLYNLLPPKTIQKPHRHNSAAIDLAVYAADSGVYTMIGKDIDNEGNIINPIKADWKNNTIFVTPPGWWHAHYNESDEDAYVFPMQDAGLQIYMRTLDIQFVR